MFFGLAGQVVDIAHEVEKSGEFFREFNQAFSFFWIGGLLLLNLYGLLHRGAFHLDLGLGL